MQEIHLKFLGARIVSARKLCALTQQELASQTKLSVETIRGIEKGRINPTYDTLIRLSIRLGVPPNTLFPSEEGISNEELQYLIWKFQSCDTKNQKMLLNVLNFLAEQLLERERESERPEQID